MAGAVAEVSALRGPFAQANRTVEVRLEAPVLRGQEEGVIRAGLNADAAALWSVRCCWACRPSS
jgi:hypothetical protein